MPYHLDYETRSRQELSDVGAYKYAECPDARILLAAISHDDEGPYLWVHPDYETGLLATDPRAELLLCQMWNSDELIFAHNCQFERAVTSYRAKDDLGMLSKTIDPNRWRCTQAMARKAQIPDSLEMAAQTLGLNAQKDARGKALIKKFSVPRDDGTFMLAAEDPAAFAEFGEYCLQDVRVERELHKRLAPFELSGIALEAFLLDIYLNDRGVPSSSSYRSQQLQAMTEAIKPLPAEYLAAAIPFLTSLMDVPFKRQMVEAFRAVGEHPTPEQIEQQKQEAIQQALKDAGNELKARELEIKERKADSEIRGIDAKSVQVGVQAAFSAMQAGAQIAQMPMIAPIADAVMQGAGYQRPNPLGDDPNFPVADQTAAMNIKSPYIQGEGAESVATPEGEMAGVRTNTSPTYPPVPDDGASPMQGIETPLCG